MFRNALLVSAAVVGFARTPAPALELPYIPNHSTAQKVVQSDAAVVGKVVEIEKEEVEVQPYQGAPDKMKMRVATVKISDALFGAKNVTHVKVLIPGMASEVPAADPAAAPFVRRRVYYPGNGTVTLKDNQEGLFYLTKHPTAGNYFHIQAGSAPVEAKAEAFKDDVANVKAAVAALADPMKALKAEKAQDRLTTAALLIQKYRRGVPSPAKQVAIPAEETKAILKALYDADWTLAEQPQAAAFDYQSQPMNLLSQLGLYSGGNGFPAVNLQPNESQGKAYHEAYKTWHAKSADKFEIKKFVPKD